MRRLVATGLVLAVALAGIAIAAAPRKGATYRGTIITGGAAISWKVTATGKKVKQLAITNTPLFCEGGGAPVPLKFPAAAISKKGRFTTTATRKITEGPSAGKPQVEVTINGRFAKGGKATGTLKADWFGPATDCDGKTTFTAATG